MDARSSFETKVLAAFTAAVLVVAALAATTWKVSRDANEAALRLAHTYQVLDSLADIKENTLLIESITRGYIISGAAGPLAERGVATSARETSLRRIKKLTADNARQQERWMRLREAAEVRWAVSERAVRLRATEGFEAARAYSASAPVRETRERMFQVLREMEEEERRLLNERSAEQVRAREIAVTTGAIAALMLIVLLSATYLLIRRQLRARDQAENALLASREEAATANRAKSTFLATMSHEIRTPMNGVLGMIELLSLTKLDAEQRITIEVVRESGKSLLRIIDDILDFSKIEAGKLEVRPEPASVEEIVQKVVMIYSGNASNKGLLIKHSVDPRISPAVLVDPLRLGQILNNFVSNALKFTAKGSIEIKAELAERAGGEDRVRFSVKDTGIGISAENQRQLFQPFNQAEGDTTRRFGGTGLGLTICGRLGEMMGGSIEMLSELGKGTTMILSLSLPIADLKDLPRTNSKGTRDSLGASAGMRRMAPSVAQAETEGTLVLLVDDHPINRMLLERLVHALGHAMESAENGVEALDKWKSGRFGIVITDCNMPKMDGYELARSIRRLESAKDGKRIPIIACTANALEGAAERCFAAGMDDYLTKPIELNKLSVKLDQWLPIPAAGTTPAETSGKRSDAPAPGADAAAPFDRSVLAEISGGDAEVERDVLLRFRAFNDEDAARLKRAVEASDLLEVIHASHRIKGASSTVGALGLATVCARLERASRDNDLNAVAADMGAFFEELERLNLYLDSP